MSFASIFQDWIDKKAGGSPLRAALMTGWSIASVDKYRSGRSQPLPKRAEEVARKLALAFDKVDAALRRTKPHGNAGRTRPKAKPKKKGRR